MSISTFFLSHQNGLFFFILTTSLNSAVGVDGNTTATMRENIGEKLQEKCEQHRINQTLQLKKSGAVYCSPIFDNLSCWGPLPANTTQYLPCPEDIATVIKPNFVKEYDETVGIKPASGKYCFRTCESDGEWFNFTNYKLCLATGDDDRSFKRIVDIIYVVGNTISFISLNVAVIIFVYFKKLMCLRNKIHCHFFLAISLRIITYFFHLTYKGSDYAKSSSPLCYFHLSMFHFTGLAKFLWMLAEGFYLVLVITWTFGLDRLKLWNFGIGAWGFPFIIVIIWIIIQKSRGYKCIDDKKNEHWFINGFIILSLVINLVIAIFIAKTLLTKLKDTQRLQRHVSTNSRIKEIHWKTMRSVLILFPLLGLTYIIFIRSPHKSFQKPFAVINAILSSTQGFFVALLFCFLNHEVQGAVKSAYRTWKERRSVPRYAYGRSNSFFVEQNIVYRRQSALNSKRLSTRREPSEV